VDASIEADTFAYSTLSSQGLRVLVDHFGIQVAQATLRFPQSW
jgi:hypothetical protein